MPRTQETDTSHRINILLVDDDAGDILLTQRALATHKRHHSIWIARDGIEAIQFLRKEKPFDATPRPDLILLDLNMPRKDGRETLAELKDDPDLQSIPVIVLTTSNADRDVNTCYELNANCFVTKPFDLTQFTKMLEDLQNFWLCDVKFPQLKRGYAQAGVGGNEPIALSSLKGPNTTEP